MLENQQIQQLIIIRQAFDFVCVFISQLINSEKTDIMSGHEVDVKVKQGTSSSSF